ncbi:hypothetical protein DSL72_000287 [Monilinia vaccinii-corymbosi]|uniref:Uncharacterized protein n=1 Tax=Monilinia vaccinii-corymbosi TaxID=61207 RepID=A0A8A3P9G1_9HELO|nr:hypothetical protein DSL72_000287 [Monilinia vaccinii-corymbosi]
MDPLPAYHELNKDVAMLVAPYLDTSSLYSGCLVYSHFNEVFGDYLWANPFRDLINRTKPCGLVSKFFFTSNHLDPKILKRVRILDVRALHKIRSERAYTNDCITFGSYLKPEWFFKFFKNFPNLNCILLAPTCSEDYGVFPGADLPREYAGIPQPEFMSASGCTTFNTSLVLRQNITKYLVYLDASYTVRSPNWGALFTIENLPNIRILKLQGLRLTDTMLPPIVTNSRRQIWSLDIRDNLLTDNSIVALLRGCFLERFPDIEYGPLRATDEGLFEHPPVYREVNEGADPLPTNMTTLRPDTINRVECSSPEGLELNVFERQNHVEDNLLMVTGLTHLYISNNKFTALGPQNLLGRTNCLQVLDAGSSRTSLAVGAGAGVDVYAQEHTACFLSRKWQPRLEVLRVHHSIVTRHPSVVSRSNKYDGKEAISNLKIEKTCRTALESQGPCFDPYDNIRLRCLTLTSIPRKGSRELFLALKYFIVRLAAQEVTIHDARENVKSRRAPALYPGLRKLTLEFLPEEHVVRPSQAASVTGLGDADSYYEEMARDFSFLNHDSIRAPSWRQQDEIGVVPTVDIVEELREWRAIEVRRWFGELQIKLF